MLLTWLQTSPDIRPFSTKNMMARSQLDSLPGKDIATIKVNHAKSVERITLGIFGNSRSIQLTAEIMRSGGTFFNFSVPGSSFRQSIIMLEYLAKVNRLPKVTIVSLDNLNLQYYANPTFPTAPTRWLQVFEDLRYGIQSSNIELIAVMKMIKRHTLIEWQVLIETFNLNILQSRLNQTLNLAANFNGESYGLDGSRFIENPTRAITHGEIPITRTNIINGYLTYDLKRLAQIQAAGTKVIVYESPIYTNISGTERPNVKITRDLFLRSCKELLLACYQAPVLIDNNPWSDISHAPANSLGPWVSRLIKDSMTNLK